MTGIGTYKDHCILPLLDVTSNKLGSEGYPTKVPRSYLRALRLLDYR